MVATTSAFEIRIGAALRSPLKCTHRYTEEAPEAISQTGVPMKTRFHGVGLWAKKPLQRQALLDLRKAGA